MFKGRLRHSWLPFFAADFVAIVAAYYLTVLLRFHSDWGAGLFDGINRALGMRVTGDIGWMFEPFYIVSAPRILFFVVSVLGLLYALRGLYPGRRFLRPRPETWNILVAGAGALVVFYAYFYLSRNAFHPRSFFATLLAINVVLTVALRTAIARGLIWLRTRHGFDRHPAILLGAGDAAGFLRIFLPEFEPHGIHLAGEIAAQPGESFEQTLARVADAARAAQADLIIAVDRDLTIAQIMQLLELADSLDASVKVLTNKLDVIVTQARLPADTIHGEPLVHFEAPSSTGRMLLVRQALARVAAAAALLLLAPLLTLIALLIKATSPGPVFFTQERLGVNRRPFTMLKFRTMHNRAEELQAQVEEFNEAQGALFKVRKDPRVTTVGRFLRRFSLDELPQLFNVLRGDMTLVGPRPLPRRDFAHYYEEWHYTRHGGLPGLTCLWQVSGRSDLDFHSMCVLDVFYLRNQSWVLDLTILLRTAWVVFFAKGAY